MSMIENTCPNCKGELIFDVKTRLYKCEYCGTSFRETSDEEINMDSYTDTIKEELHEEQTKFEELVLDKILPFTIDKAQVEEIILEYTRKKVLVSAEVIDQFVEKMEKIYVPFFVANCCVDTKLSGIGTKITVSNEDDGENTITEKYKVERHEYISFEQFSKIANDGEIEKRIKEIQSFDFNEAVEFKETYLPETRLIERTIEMEEVFHKFYSDSEKCAMEIVKEKVPEDVSFENGIEVNANMREFNGSCVWVPVWVSVYENTKKDTYYSVINGQNGMISGTFPASPNKMKQLGIELAILGLIIILMGYQERDFFGGL